MTEKTALDRLMAAGRTDAAQKGFPRVAVEVDGWREMIGALAAGELDLLSLWGEPGTVHAAVLDGGRVAVLSLDCPDGKFPSVGARHAPAIRFERALADLYGLVAKDAKDTRPWLDHGRWEMRHPLANAPATGEASAPYPFLAVDGEHLHQIPVGPVHAGIIEPGHFRFTANGETVARLEVRLGYAHKGIAGLMRGQDLAGAAHLAGHVSGDSTVAYAIAFARAAEAALGIEAPARAHWLRALMAEIERLANHFGDIGAICNDASFSIMHAHCAVLRESLLRFADTHFGHRLMMGAVVPGGVGVDLAADGGRQLLGLAAQIKGRFAQLTELYDNAASLLDRTVGTGLLKPELARRFAAGGFVGRASGRDFDARRDLPYPPYDRLGFAVPTLSEGDVNARVWIRIREAEASLNLIEEIVAQLPDGNPLTALPTPGSVAEGLAVVEGFRGEVLVWLRLGADGRVAECHLRDPSALQWPLLEAAIEGNIVADFPLCNKSFNCSYSGHDL